jgi:uncharacterized protein
MNGNLLHCIRLCAHSIVLLSVASSLTACGDEPRTRVGTPPHSATGTNKFSKPMTSIRIEEHFEGRQRELAEAAAKADRTAIKRLVAAGIDPNTRSGSGMPLMLWPMYRETPDGFAALFENGANPNQTDHRGSPVAAYAAKNPDIRYLETLLRAGANPNARNIDREPLTFVAAMEGHWEHVKLLIEKGAEIDAFNHENEGDTLLAYYANGQFERALWLLERGADPTFKNKDAIAKNRIGAQPILELIFHYKIDANRFPKGAAAQKKCQEFVLSKGIKPVAEPNYLKAK